MVFGQKAPFMVCVICYLLVATCGPKGHGSGLPLPIGQRRLFTYNHSLAQIGITDHSRAPPSPSPLTRLYGVCV